MAEVWAMIMQPKKGGSGGSGSSNMGSGIGTGGNGLLKVPNGFGQGDSRRRGHR